MVYNFICCSFLRGKSNLATRLDGTLRGPVSIQTPCTALNRGPPNFQQTMQLTESDSFDK